MDIKLKTLENLKPDLDPSQLDMVADLVTNHANTIDATGDTRELIEKYARPNGLLMTNAELRAIQSNLAYKDYNQKVQAINNDPKLSRMAKDHAFRSMQ